MSDQQTPPPDDAALLAAEYVLGVLGPTERREAGARLRRDPAFAAEVRAWTERMGPLTEEAAAVAPPPEVWSEILREIGGAARAANDDRALRTWRRLALGASGLAAASLAAVALLLARPPEPAAQVASLTTPQGATALLVAFDAETGALLVTPGPGLRTQGHTPHLWLVQPGGGVQLVGAIDPSRTVTHNLPRALSRSADAAQGLALSLEPPGHEPIDRPGGPTVASGDFEDL